MFAICLTLSTPVLGVRPGALRRRARARAASSVLPSAHLLVIGVITAPLNFDQRTWQRMHYAPSLGSMPDVAIRYVLGNMSGCGFSMCCNREPLAVVHWELQRYADWVRVEAPECSKTSVAHKTLAWYRHAAGDAAYALYQWIAKVDDDSLLHLPKLRADMLLMAAQGRREGGRRRHSSYAYYGTLRWRLWQPPLPPGSGPTAQNAGGCPALNVGCACGSLQDAWLPDSLPAQRALVLETAACKGAVGPFPFADGSLNVMSSRLAREALEEGQGTDRPTADDFRADAGWDHEDVGLAYLLLRRAAALQLPVTYFTLEVGRPPLAPSPSVRPNAPLTTTPHPRLAAPPARRTGCTACGGWMRARRTYPSTRPRCWWCTRCSTRCTRAWWPTSSTCTMPRADVFWTIHYQG